MPDEERVLETRRLSLEPLMPRHGVLLYAYLCDPRLYRYYAGAAPSSVGDLEQQYGKWSTRRSPDGIEVWLNWAVRERGGGYVGRLQATIIQDEATIGYDIFPPFWRRGFAKEACAVMLRFVGESWPVRLFAALADTENAASIALLRSLGFVRTWTGPSDDLPGRLDHRYEKEAREFLAQQQTKSTW